MIGAQQAFESQQHSDVPIMIGFTRDESFRSLGPVASVDELELAVGRVFPSTAPAVLAAYRAHDAASAARAAADIGRDASVGAQMASWARAQAKFSRSPAYAYFFARRQPYAPGITFIDHDPATAGAYHSAEIPYFLRTRDSLNLFRQTRIWEDVDVALEEDMGQLLVSFARDGKPTSAARTGLAGIRPEAAARRSARSRDRGRRLAELRVAGAAGRGRRRCGAGGGAHPRARLSLPA